MARTLLTATTFADQTCTVTAGTRDVLPVASDQANGNRCAWPTTGKVYLLCQNADAAPQTITITAAADKWARTGAISAYSMAANDLAFFGPFEQSVWKDSTDGLIFTTSDADLKVVVIVTP